MHLTVVVGSSPLATHIRKTFIHSFIILLLLWVVMWFIPVHMIRPNTRSVKKVLGLMYFGTYPGMNSLPLLFNIISLHLDALSPSLFQFAYPFKIEVFILVPQVLIYCIYDTFIASEIPTMKVSFQLWEQIEVRRAKSGEYGGWGRTSKPHSVAAAIATCDVWAGALSCKSRTPRVNFPLLFLHNLLTQPPHFFCIICTVYRATFLKIINHDYSLIIPKDRGHHLPCWRNSLKFLKEGWARVLPLHALLLDSGSKWWTQVSSWVTTRSINSSGSSS